MSFNQSRPVRFEEDPDFLGGPNGMTDDLLLQSGGTDRILHHDDSILLQSNGDEILQSSHTDYDEMLQSAGDNIYLSGGTDLLLITGYFNSSLLDGSNFIKIGL